MTANIHNTLDQGLSENIRLAASVARVLIIVGKRQHDRFITVNQDGKPLIASLEGILWTALNPIEALWNYDPATELPSLCKIRPEIKLSGSLPTEADTLGNRLDTATLLSSFMGMQVNNGKDKEPMRLALLLDSALLWEEPGHPRDQDHAVLRVIEHFSRTHSQNEKMIILRTDSLTSIPPALSASPSVRVVSLPTASRDERVAYTRIRGGRLAKQCGLDVDALARVIANSTDDWRLEDMEGLIRNCEQQQLKMPTELDSTARAYRMGVTRSPWAGVEVQTAIDHAEERLVKRVRGQPAAITAICTALGKASVGLSGAYQSGFSRGPRATLFFAGPTGTGKTESAKAIAELVFGDESAMIRFDCAEFRQDHSVARLIGAPPGYVGYETGGELTDKVRTRPHSVLLFDEIEKAHPRLLDIFLSILDDGRLTDGQGVTTDFSECILIFTSNLGIYEETTDEYGRIVRRPRFDFEASYDEIQVSVRNAIREEFISTLGRPELLGRFGGERALVVFDYLRDLTGVVEKFLTNIRIQVKRLHDIDMDVSTEVIRFIAADTASRPDALVLGARGIAQSLDGLFTDSLANFIRLHKAKNCTVLASMNDNLVQFSFSKTISS